MPYLTKENVKTIRSQLKAAFPEFKFSVRSDRRSLDVAIMRGPLEFVPGKTYHQLNEYHLGNYAHSDVLQRMLAIINQFNHDNSRAEYDYFDVGYYVHFNVGKWNQPFVLTTKPETSPELDKALDFLLKM